MNVRHPMVVLHSFSIKNIFYDKMDLSLFYTKLILFLDKLVKGSIKYNLLVCAFRKETRLFYILYNYYFNI